MGVLDALPIVVFLTRLSIIPYYQYTDCPDPKDAFGFWEDYLLDFETKHWLAMCWKTNPIPIRSIVSVVVSVYLVVPFLPLDR